MLTPPELSTLLDHLEQLKDRGVGEALGSVQSQSVAILPVPGSDTLIPVALEHAVAFANGGGGDVVFGVAPDGEIQGVGDLDSTSIIREIFSLTRPGLTCDAWFHEREGKKLLVLNIPQSSGLHATADGRRLRRFGAQNLPITPDQDAHLMVERGAVDPSDRGVEGASFEDIDPVQIAYLREILRQKHDQHDMLALSPEELLESLGLIHESGQPRLAALLLLGKRAFLEQHLPQVEVIYAHYDEHEEAIHQSHLILPLLHTLSRLQDLIEARNRFVTLKQGLFHHKIKDFDDEVYREALVNALVHRDYTRRDGTVYVHHHPDRLEVANPGGFIGGIHRDNILYHAPRHRNRRLAEVMLQLGLMERGGHGVNRLYRFLLRRGKEAPHFEDTPHSVHLTLQGGGLDEAFAKFVSDEESRGRVLTLDTLIVLGHLRRQRTIDSQVAATICQRPRRAVGAALAKMVDYGYLERLGARRGTTGYSLSPRLYKAFQGEMSYFRDRGLDARRQRALIMEVAEELGGLTLDDIRELCAVDQAGAQLLARQLVDEGLLKATKGADGRRNYVPVVDP